MLADSAVTVVRSAYESGVVTVELETDHALEPGWQLAFTSVARLSPLEQSAVQMVDQVGTYHCVAAAPPVALRAGGRWSVELVPSHELRHANDGPASAWVITADGALVGATVEPTTALGRRVTPAPPDADVSRFDRRGDPLFAWRGLHIDLARQWFEPGVVEWLIDVVAERGLNRLHLHLTDDEGWRMPVDGYPELADAATRGDGLVLPPMLGGGPAPTGRLYTDEEIAEWVARADSAGVVLVPEIDMPAHMHAALVALPQLRDPDDTSGARSVQGFVDNVLVPGHGATDDFLDAVIDSVARLFPSSPWIHIGGDEVPDGAWAQSPVVARFAAERGVEGAEAITAEFLRDVVRRIRERTGREVGVWQEAAECGGVSPGDGYVVTWRSVGASRRLAAAGFDVVVAPGSAYYFDMAVDDAWETPGASWAGSTPLQRVAEFEPGRGWSDEERSHLLGLQACLWTEHVHDRAAIERQLLPRLDAFAERAWTGRHPHIVGSSSAPSSSRGSDAPLG